MDFGNKRCGECGKRGFSQENVHGVWQRPWKDYPSVFMTQDFHIWKCNHCKAEASAAGSGAEADAAIEKSLRDQTSQFLEIIKNKSNFTFEEIATRIGVSAPYLSDLRRQKKTPSFGLWNMLKMCAKYPELLRDVLDPDYDIEKGNILLRRA